jgi:acetyl-CoA acetyltransferase family protein
MSRDVYIGAAVRTAIGRHGGALAAIRPDDLAAAVIRGLMAQLPELDPVALDEVYFGNANGAGEDNRNVARMATLLAGLPVTIPGASVNRLCGSGMEAVFDASRAIAVGDADLVLAGGVESMTRAPWVVEKPAKGYPTANQTMWNTSLGWRMTNPKMPGEWTVSLGEATELLAEKYSISREACDAFAATSHQRAAAAWAAGLFAGEIVPVPDITLDRDECIRPDTTAESLAKLKPSFRSSGVITAGNASPLNDGASAMVLGDDTSLARSGIEPLARVVSRGTAGVESQFFGVGPVEAARAAMRRAGLGFDDLDAIELNEAFAAQSLACLGEWPDIDPAKVNPVGGAIAIGHPLGCSGARIITTLAHHLARTGGRYGLATMCIGVGQGIAVVIENVRR